MIKGVYEKLGIVEASSTQDGASALNRRTRAVAIALTGRKINKIIDIADTELLASSLEHFLDG